MCLSVFPRARAASFFWGRFNPSSFHTVILEPKSLRPSLRFARRHRAAAVLGAGRTFGLCHPEWGRSWHGARAG